MLKTLRSLALGTLAAGVAGASLSMLTAGPALAASRQANPASSVTLHLPSAAAHAQGHMQPDPVYFYDPEED